MVQEVQSLLLQEGVLEAAADVLRWAPEEEVKAMAARLLATLADTAVPHTHPPLSLSGPVC
jgi:hypothetical protein